jgi:antitoxin VapB
MYKTHIAKLLKNGTDQMVQLPPEFRFEGDEVYISRDDATGDVVLSNHPNAKIWSEFFAFVRSIDVPADFMAERPMNIPPQTRVLFGDEQENTGEDLIAFFRNSPLADVALELETELERDKATSRTIIF